MLRLYDTQTREVRDFVPLEEGKAGLYVCGLTVQSEPHVGHVRSAVNFDVLQRWLRYRGYDVTFIRNTTDIDDKILLMGSASALRGMKRASTYSAARGAQLAYVQAIGMELAAHNVQVNAVAQNFVDNPTYFPPEVQANPRFQERLAREVPLGRLVSAREDALFAAYLCSPAADCFVGQVFPVCGGWVGR